MADYAERGVVFKLMSQVDPSAKATLAEFAKSLKDVQVDMAKGGFLKMDAKAAVQSMETAAKAVAQSSADQNKQIVAGTVATTAKQVAATNQWVTAHVSSAAYVKQVAADAAAAAEAREAMITASVEKELAKRAAEDKRIKEESDAWNKEHGERGVKEAIIRDRKKLESAIWAAEAEAKAKQRIAFQEATEQRNKQGRGDRNLGPLELDGPSTKEMSDGLKAHFAGLFSEVNEGLAEMGKNTSQETVRASSKLDTLRNRVQSAHREISNNFLEMGEAVMRFARGLTAMGLVGEKDMDKVKDALLRMQSAVDIFSGLGRVLAKSDQILQQIRTATLAQAAAQAILNKTTVDGIAAESAHNAVRSNGLLGRGVAAVSNIGSRVINAGSVVGMTAGGGAFAVGAAAIGAFTGAIFGAVSSIFTFREALKNGIGGGAKPGGFVEGVGTSYFNPFAYVFGRQARTDRNAAIERTTRMEKASENGKRMDNEDWGRIEAAKSQQSGAESARAQVEEQMLHNAMATVDAKTKQKMIDDEIARLNKSVADGNDKDRGKLLSWMGQRISNEKEIASIARATAKEQEESARRQLAHLEDKLEKEKASQMSAVQRFGAKSEEDQEEILDIAKRYRGGDQTLTSDELGKLHGLTSTMDKQLENTFAQRGMAAGFGMFDPENQAAVADLEKQVQQQMNVEVKAKHDIVVKIDTDQEAMVKRFTDEMTAVLSQERTALDEKLKKIAEEIVTNQSRLNRRNANIPGFAE